MLAYLTALAFWNALAKVMNVVKVSTNVTPDRFN